MTLRNIVIFWVILEIDVETIFYTSALAKIEKSIRSIRVTLQFFEQEE